MQLFEVRFTLDLGFQIMTSKRSFWKKRENQDTWSIYPSQALQSCPEDSLRVDNA